MDNLVKNLDTWWKSLKRQKKPRTRTPRRCCQKRGQGQGLKEVVAAAEEVGSKTRTPSVPF